MGSHPVRVVVGALNLPQTCSTLERVLIFMIYSPSLDRNPPIPTMQQGPHPLHKYLGFVPSRHIISTSLRDPFDGREMPANGPDFVNAYCLRGVKKVYYSATEAFSLSPTDQSTF